LTENSFSHKAKKTKKEKGKRPSAASDIALAYIQHISGCRLRVQRV
jgi:hypothetical protein